MLCSIFASNLLNLTSTTFCEVLGQYNRAQRDGYNSTASSSGVSSDCEIVQGKLNEKFSLLNVQLEACQKVLSANNNQLEKQSNTIKTLEVTNSCLTSHKFILEADLASQEQKNRNLESNLDRIDLLENLVSWLVEQREAANARISNLTGHECKCLHNAVYHQST